MLTFCALETFSSIGEELIPSSQQPFLVLMYKPSNPIYLRPIESSAVLKPDGADPELSFIVVTFDVNMGRLLAVT